MRIRKVTQSPIPVEEASIVDGYSTSQTNGYSCNYSNDNFADIFKFKFFSSSVTVNANSIITKDMGSTDTPTGYTYIGVINKATGVGDQWLVTFGLYGSSHIYAMVHSKHSSSLTATISCTAIYVKSSYYTEHTIS